MKLLRLLWVLFLVPITIHANNLDKDLVEKVLNTTVRIVSYKVGDREKTGVGAGVIVSESGLILTNYHVIHGRDKIKVYLWKDRMRTPHMATVLGTDPIADLALLDIDPWPDEVFRVAELETDIQSIYAGTEVIAVGHPLRLKWTITKGIINSVNRQSFITPYVFLVQHDAVINEGNSGGPLFNLEGNLVGINTYMISPKEHYTGMGYAVQIDSVAKSLPQMMELGVVVRPALKLNLINLGDDVREFIIENEEPDPWMPNTFGMIMNFIEPGGLGDTHGLQNFDVIVAMDGYPTNDMRDVAAVMYGKMPGDTVILLILRRGEFMLVPYTLGTLSLPDNWYDEREPSKAPAPPTPEEKDLQNE